jgi:predicted transcriptional regulator
MKISEFINEIEGLSRDSRHWELIKSAYRTRGVHLPTLISVLQFHERQVSPTINDVADDLGIEYTTAQKYLKKLCRMGILVEERKKTTAGERSRLVYKLK